MKLFLEVGKETHKIEPNSAADGPQFHDVQAALTSLVLADEGLVGPELFGQRSLGYVRGTADASDSFEKKPVGGFME